MHRRVAAVLLIGGCGRVEFGYPVKPCEEAPANASFLWCDNEHCYARSDLASTYGVARASCVTIGGYPATLTTADENAAVASALQIPIPARLGLEDGALGRWTWMTNEPTTYANWASGQPVPCELGGVVTTGLLDRDGTWTTACVDAGEPFLCEIDPWLTDPASGHGYRLTWGYLDWYQSDALCRTFDGHLATIGSLEELSFLSQLAMRSPGFLWLGGSADGTSFSWVTGEPFSYTNWGPNQPSTMSSGTCVMLGSSEWQAQPCAGPGYGICEIE